MHSVKNDIKISFNYTNEVHSLDSSKSKPEFLNHLSHVVKEGKGINEKVTEFNAKLVRELNNVILASESEIEKNITSLENDTELVEASLDMELIMQSYPEFSLQIISNLTEFFSAVLPAKLMDLPWIENSLNLTHGIASLGGIFLASMANGSQLTAVICKHKILKQSRSLLENLKADFQAKLVSQDPAQLLAISSEAREKTEAVLTEWNKALKVEEKKLKQDKQELLTSSAFNFLYVGFEVINWLPLAKLSLIAEKALLLTASLGAQTVIFIAHDIEFVRALLQADTFKSHRKAYTQWQKENTAVIEITQHITQEEETTYAFEREILQMIERGSPLEVIKNTIEAHLNTHPDYQIVLNGIQDLTSGAVECLDVMITKTKNLLHKRQAIGKKKALLMQAEFEQLKPKIELRARFLYEQQLSQIHEILINPLSSPAQIEKELNEVVSFTENAQNASLLTAFQEYQEAVFLHKIDRVPARQTNLAYEFYAGMVNAKHVENQFQAWFLKQPRTKLIRDYIDNQSTIQQPVKNALKEIVAHKQALENKFLNLKLFSKGSICTMSLFCLSVSVALIIAALLTVSTGGAVGALLLITAIGPAVVGLGLMMIDLLYQFHHKPHTVKAWTLPIKISWNRIHRAFYAYRHSVKKRKLWDTAKVLRQLHAIQPNKRDPGYQKAFNDYQQAKTKFESSKEKIEVLTRRLTKLERELAHKGWMDFIRHATLAFSDNPKAFDSLQAISKALMKCDADNLDPELEYLLEECGMDLAPLQSAMRQDPQAIPTALQFYGALNLENMIELMRN